MIAFIIRFKFLRTRPLTEPWEPFSTSPASALPGHLSHTNTSDSLIRLMALTFGAQTHSSLWLDHSLPPFCLPKFQNVFATPGECVCGQKRESERATNVMMSFSRSVMSDSLWPHGLRHAGFPVLHYLLEFAQIHVHWVGDAI